MALETFPLLHFDHDVEIAGRAAVGARVPFAAEVEIIPGFHSRGTSTFTCDSPGRDPTP